jgi:hypothetical protein
MKSKYWFANKKYGWGWTPITWQGWLITLLWSVVFIFICVYLVELNAPILLILYTVIHVGLLLTICILKGPKTRWNWGDNNRKINR